MSSAFSAQTWSYWLLVCSVMLSGCAWPMLEESALKDPLAAVEGGGQVFTSSASRTIRGGDVAHATDSELLAL